MASKRALGAVLAAGSLLLGCGGKGAGGTVPGVPPPPDAPIPGTPITWGEYRLEGAAGMTATTYSDGVVLQKADAASSYGFGCRIAFTTPVARAAGTLDDQAAAIFQQVAGSGQVVIGVNNPSPLDDFEHVTGVTGEGRPYVELAGRLVVANDHSQVYGQVRIQVIDLGARVAVMTGFQPWDAQARCFQTVLEAREWELLVYGLGFPSVPSNPAAFRAALVGGRFSAVIGPIVSTGSSDVFAANGHHADLFTVETYHQISPTEILETSSTWTGNGVWAANGNLVTVWHADGRPARTQYARILSHHGGATYLQRLFADDTGKLWESDAVKE